MIVALHCPYPTRKNKAAAAVTKKCQAAAAKIMAIRIVMKTKIHVSYAWKLANRFLNFNL